MQLLTTNVAVLGFPVHTNQTPVAERAKALPKLEPKWLRNMSSTMPHTRQIERVGERESRRVEVVEEHEHREEKGRGRGKSGRGMVREHTSHV